MPALLKRAARRAGGLLIFALLFLVVVALKGGRVPLQALVHAATGGAGLIALAVLARPVSERPVALTVQALALGLAGPGLTLLVYLQDAYLRTLARTGDPHASWTAAAREALAELSRDDTAGFAVTLGGGVGVALATLALSGVRACGHVPLVLLPALALAFAVRADRFLFVAGIIASTIVSTMLFAIVEPRRRLLSGGDRPPEA
jgi:hypothetical protein